MKIKQKNTNEYNKKKPIAKDFNIIKDVEFYLRLTFLEARASFLEYQIDNSKGISDYSFLN